MEALQCREAGIVIGSPRRTPWQLYPDAEHRGLGLIESVRQVYAGQSWLPAGKPAPARPGRPLLSRREREVLGRIAEGRRGSQIAAEMGVAVKTVDTYRRRIMQTLGLQSQSELMRYAVALGGGPGRPSPPREAGI